MNLPNDPSKNEVPPAAKGNPVYEQTREDMPLWCCGRNCGRNSRIVVLVLSLVGIACSTWVCLSHKYFQFESLRNDTFVDPEKAQPKPFEYATKANVGIFRYQILEVYEYPWPPKQQERQLAEEMLLAEARRMAEAQRFMEDDNSTLAPTNATSIGGNSTAPLDTNATDAPTDELSATVAPTKAPTNATGWLGTGSTELESQPPTGPPTPAPTGTNPNDIVAETVQIGEVLKYPERMNQFDSIFRNGQLGAMVAPILASVGIVFGLIELCCCTYKCSWLPTAMLLYLAFMLQLMTLFLFLSEDFCKYDQDCKLGYAGWLSCVAIICYLFGNSLVCCTPRPTPFFNCCKKPPVRRKKKKKKKDPNDDDDMDDMEREGLNRDLADDPDYQMDDDDEFRDEDGDGHVDPYYDEEDGEYGEGYDEFDDGEGDYGDETVDDDDAYADGSYRDYDNDTYAQDTFAGDTYGEADQSYYDDGQSYDDYDGGTYDDQGTYDSQYT